MELERLLPEESLWEDSTGNKAALGSEEIQEQGEPSGPTRALLSQAGSRVMKLEVILSVVFGKIKTDHIKVLSP